MARSQGAKGFGVDPGHQAAHQHAEWNRSSDQKSDQKGAGEASQQVVGLAQAGTTHQGGKPGLLITDHHVGDEGGDHENCKDIKSANRLQDGEGRVDMNIAPGADMDVLRGHAAKREQEKQNRSNRKERRAQLIPDFKTSDLGKHKKQPTVATGTET